MHKLTISMAAIVVGAALGANAEGLVANPSMEIEARQGIKPIMGSSYWTWLESRKYANLWTDVSKPPENPELLKVPFIRDSALHVPCGGRPPEGKSTFRRVCDNFGGENSGGYRMLEARTKPDKPLILRLATKRSVYAFAGELDLDYEDWKAWKARHPEFWACEMMDEWDNEIKMFHTRKLEPALREEINKRWGKAPVTRQEKYDFAKRFYDYTVDLYYGASNDVLALSSQMALHHIAAAWGAKSLWIEQSNTVGDDREYRWDTQQMFVRGAARQFQVPWGWFAAVYMNGFAADGKVFNNSTCWEMPYPEKSKEARPWCGISSLLERRQWYWAYLNGANGVEPEMWFTRFIACKPGDIYRLTKRGEYFAEYHDFAEANKDRRGVTYAPVAILTPQLQGYATWGGCPWTNVAYKPGDLMVDSMFFGLIPGHHREDGIKAGKEFNLHNTPMAMMYDVLVPDTTQKKEDFAKALAPYRVAILAGDYPDYGKFAEVLKAYVREGGTLIVNAANVLGAKGAFDEEFLGAKVEDAMIPAGKAARDENGKKFWLEGEYSLAKVTPGAATPFLWDELKNVLATTVACGKGKVILTAPMWSSPWKGAPTMSEVPTQRGDIKFAFNRYLFGRLQDELFPVAIKGDCEFGINRCADGKWWLWVFNNRGVRKFADQYEQVDQEGKTDIRVDFKRIKGVKVQEMLRNKAVPLNGNGFEYVIASGDLAVFEICE